MSLGSDSAEVMEYLPRPKGGTVAFHQSDAIVERAGELFALVLFCLAIGTLMLDVYAATTLK